MGDILEVANLKRTLQALAREPAQNIDQLPVRGAARIVELITRVRVGQPAQP